MAKTKNTTTSLSLTDRLQSALVPEEKQPYKIPKNWVWVKLGNLYEINPRVQAEDNVHVAFIPMEKITPGMISDFEYEEQLWGKAKKGHTQFADGDVAFAKISPCFENRKSMMVRHLPNGIGSGTTELIILRNSKILQSFTFWLISSEKFISEGRRTYAGTVGQQRISMNFVRSFPIPLPPLAEQGRIVARIESLFGKLDEVKERVQNALDSYET
ncbi:MAG: restriction endonuclease subunit S, partial [Planctomycetia bacterium]|nr:restriction endonuclease subunit S [Planctomycetia bacterium]